MCVNHLLNGRWPHLQMAKHENSPLVLNGGWRIFFLAKRFLMMPCHFSHHPDTQSSTRISTRHVNYAAATWHLMSHQMVHIPLLRVQ